MPSQYKDKKAENIKQVVAAMLERRIKDPRLGFVTITDVRLSNDGREASIFYTVLGGQADFKATQAALKSATGMLRTAVGQKLKLKFAPSLVFIPDALEEQASEFEDALAKAREHDEEVARLADGAEY
ncbi:MAG: 30S ribosome-binding factor RbfA, partial [Propionibacteriaceae bacterium]|nr:30S ribosome-binding factor RbfA [Propionibacteriaceae bacterium]